MTREEVYVALLRGINVGGNKIVLMDDLKRLFEKLKFTEVRTYIQSGNVVFVSKKAEPSELAKAIKDGIKHEFKFDVEVVVLELSELKKMIARNPFDDEKLKAGGRVYLTLLLRIPLREKIAEFYEMKNGAIKKTNPADDFEIIEGTVYVLCRNGWSKSPFNSSVTEKILKVETTSRNIETMQKLVEIGKA